jgi:DNA-binding transcriptional regulator GbsR (MarR family)
VQRKPLLTIAEATQTLGLTRPAVAAGLQHLQDLGIVRLVAPRARNRVFVYDAYLDILGEGTEPIR